MTHVSTLEIEEKGKSQRRMTDMQEYDVRFQENFKVIICGGSGSGKTVLARKIIQQATDLMVEAPKSIHIFFQMDQPAYEDFNLDYECSVSFIEGIPSKECAENIIKNSPKPALILVDDAGLHLNETIAELFSVGSHHGNLCLSMRVTFYKIDIY